MVLGLSFRRRLPAVRLARGFFLRLRPSSAEWGRAGLVPGPDSSSTIFYEKGYRFFFFSREEIRIYVHVQTGNGEAKFWLEPEVELAKNFGLTNTQIKEIVAIVKERSDEIKKAWGTHF